MTLATPEYDSFADIYAVWADTADSTRANLTFYLNTYASTDGPVVELGVGDGRIAVEAASRGCAVTGVDLSSTMLARCRQRATAAGVLDRLTLIHGDFLTFQLDTPAALIALPYHSLGHLISLEDKRRAVAHVFSQLRPGGRFIFDDYVMTPALIARMRSVQLRATYTTADGRDALLWVTSLLDEALQSIQVVTWEDLLDAAGLQTQRRYRRLTLSWLSPAEARELLGDAGFAVEACYGDFDRSPWAEATAREQIWVARKPA